MKKLPLLFGAKKKLYTWRDTFNADLAAGAVHNSTGTPGYRTGAALTRTVVDTYTTTEMVLNPGFETAGAGEADVHGSWTETAGDGAIADEGTLVHGGSHALKLTSGATSNTKDVQTIAVITGYTYNLSLWTRGDGTYGGSYEISTYKTKTATGVTGTDYTEVTFSFTATSTGNITLTLWCPATNTGIAYFDDVSLLPTTGLLSVSGGKLTVAGGKSVPGTGDPGLWYPAVTRAAGVALYGKILASSYTNAGDIAFDTDTTTGGVNGIGFSSGKFYMRFGSALLDLGDAATGGVEYPIMIIAMTTGALSFVKISGAWKMLYPIATDSTATLYPAIRTYNLAFTADDLRLLSLPAPFNTDYGIATQRLAGARSAGNTFTHEANCVIEWTVTTLTSSSGQTIVINFRQPNTSDNNNRWAAVVADDGSGYLTEVVSGSPTSRGTFAAGSIANGQRMVVIADGSTIKVYANNVLKITYASATNFATETAGKVSGIGTGGAVSDIVSYPRYPSGTALQDIESRTR